MAHTSECIHTVLHTYFQGYCVNFPLILSQPLTDRVFLKINKYIYIYMCVCVCVCV